MTIVDRYVFLLFAKVFVVCFASLAGLFVVIHLFTNLDDLLHIPDRASQLPALLLSFYGPRILDFLDRSSSVLCLVAACFAMAMLQRRRELIAIEGAGICRQRLLWPVFAAAVIVTGVAFWNRETLIPKYREQLVRTPQTWQDDKQFLSYFQKDHRSGLHIKGSALDLAQQLVLDPIVQIPLHLSRSVNRLSGKKGRFVAADAQHPAGLLIEDLDETMLNGSASDLLEGDRPVVYFSAQHSWLPKNACLVATSLTLDDLAFGEKLSEYASIWELVQGSSRPSQWYSRSSRISIHNRLVRPVLDITLLLVALPLVLTQSEHRLWRAVLIAILCVVGSQVLLLVGTALGSIGFIPSAAMAAWLPLFVMIPLTPWTLGLMRR